VSDQDGGEEASRDDPRWDAFEARFPPEAFAGVARALGQLSDPETLSSLRRSLVEPFYFFYLGCGDKPSRAERIKGLSRLRDAARILLRLDPVDGDPWTALTRQTFSAVWDEQFRAILERVADDADRGIRRYHSSQGKAGRPRKDAFWQLTADLVRAYERAPGQVAKKPDWLGGNKYGGEFYEFAVAVERCLRTGFAKTEVLRELPDTPAAIGDGLRKHWAKIRRMAGEKSPSIVIQ
jgi:hypothetical protein